MKHRSFYLQSKYGLMTHFLPTKIAHDKEILLTVKKNCSRKSNLLRARICSCKNLLTEFACSIEKLLMMKNLAGSDGSTQRLNFLHPVKLSTAGAHDSTVSVLTAGMCFSRTFQQNDFRSVVLLSNVLYYRSRSAPKHMFRHEHFRRYAHTTTRITLNTLYWSYASLVENFRENPRR